MLYLFHLSSQYKVPLEPFNQDLVMITLCTFFHDMLCNAYHPLPKNGKRDTLHKEISSEFFSFDYEVRAQNNSRLPNIFSHGVFFASFVHQKYLHFVIRKPRN